MRFSPPPFLLAAALAVASPLAEAGSLDPEAAGPLDAGVELAFLARDLATGEEFALEGGDAEARRPPFSTFKIPNLVIAIEEGAAQGLETRKAWDERRWPPEPWWPDEWREDMTLEAAFRRSAVWWFRDLAGEIGAARYRAILAEWGYGDATAPDGSDSFWLDGSLRISAREQVDFLERLAEGRLPVSDRAREALFRASLAGEAENVALHGKTGAGRAGAGWEGWYVGFTMRSGRPETAFALHMSGPSFASIREARRRAAVALLKSSGRLPEGFPRE